MAVRLFWGWQIPIYQLKVFVLLLSDIFILIYSIMFCDISFCSYLDILFWDLFNFGLIQTFTFKISVWTNLSLFFLKVECLSKRYLEPQTGRVKLQGEMQLRSPVMIVPHSPMKMPPMDQQENCYTWKMKHKLYIHKTNILKQNLKLHLLVELGNVPYFESHHSF